MLAALRARPTQFSGLTKVFDLDDPAGLIDANHGSGADEYHILIPVGALTGFGDYLTLFASFSAGLTTASRSSAHYRRRTCSRRCLTSAS